MNKAEIIEAIKAMNVLELSELVKELEEVFGVSAAAPAAVAVAGGAAAPGGNPAPDCFPGGLPPDRLGYPVAGGGQHRPRAGFR